MKGMPPTWVEPERVRERWESALSWEVPKVVAEAATPRPWNMDAMLGLKKQKQTNKTNEDTLGFSSPGDTLYTCFSRTSGWHSHTTNGITLDMYG